MTRLAVDPEAHADLLAVAQARRGDPREHWCEHPGCRRWGAYSVDFGRSWFCREHRQDPDGWPCAQPGRAS